MNPPSKILAQKSAGALLAGVLVAAGWLGLSPGWRGGETLVHASYDVAHRLAGADHTKLASAETVIIYLDLQSSLALRLDPTRPWPRALHAQLVRRLTAAGARAVVFDVVFNAPGGDPAIDADFANALRAHGRVVLGAELSAGGHDSGAAARTQSWKLELPAEPLRSAAGWGVTELRIERDLAVRRQFAGHDAVEEPSLAWAAARLAGDAAPPPPAPLWVRYYGPPHSLRHVSYHAALSAADTPDEIFRGKIVFIGARPAAGLLNERRDEFRSPFHVLANRDLFHPGVEVHATQTLNLLRGDSLRRLPPLVEGVILALVAVLMAMGLIGLRPWPATGAALLLSMLTVGGAQLAFARGVWFPWLVVVAVQAPVALAGAYLFQFAQWFTVRRKLEAQRRADEAKIREQAALLDKAHDAILVQDVSGRVLYVNPGAAQLYGCSLAELQSDGALAQLASPDAGATQAARAATLAHGEWNGELRQSTRAGKVVTVASRWTLIRDDDGQPKALLQINSDITEKKELEAQFLRAQRLETIGNLAGGMAHDLNNALSPILMGAQILRRRAGDDEQRRLLDVIEASTHRGAGMVRQVLLFARGKEGEFQQLELAPLVREIEKLARDTFPKNITFGTFLPSDLWPVRGDATQLHQILLNLCVNARDAMPDGGKISIAADNVDVDAAEVAEHPGVEAGPFVSLLVSDTGTGMTPEVRARIFEPFFTTKGEGKGTGIGLATVTRIVKAHGGFLRVESAPGEGTTFEVLLPRAIVAEPAVGQPAASAPPRGHGELILVADDEQAIRELLADSLAAHGYRVLTAPDGATAVSLFRAHQREVRLLFSDSAMPVIDGLRAIQSIRATHATLPVILASGEGAAEVPAGVTPLRKPFAVDEVLWALHRALQPVPSDSKLGKS